MRPELSDQIVRQLSRLLLYGVLFAFLATAAARLLGYAVSIEKRTGSTRGTSIVDLADADSAPGESEDLFDGDFPPDAEVRNIILLIADGLGFSQVAAARSQLGGLNRRLGFERMPITGWVMTHEAGSLITDSAAGATAIATGEKTDLGMLSVAPGGRTLPTVAEIARESGRSAGLVTDSYLVDATPAAFLTHLASRREYPQVAAQMAASGAELLIGELTGSEEVDPQTLDAFRAGGYSIADRWESLAGLASGRVAGLFEPGAIADPERAPSLAQLTEHSLGRLAADPEGFFLLIETEETDSASHNRQFQRLVAGIRAFDEAVERALDFARRDRATLVVVTADHETGGLVLLSGRQGEKLGVRWSTSGHTGSPVPLYAYGPGARRFAGVRDNAEIGRLLIELLEEAPSREAVRGATSPPPPSAAPAG